MRNLKKIIAAMSVAAIAMTSTAFAASTTKATYDSTTNKVALTLADGELTASGQMTVVVVPKTFGSGDQTDAELASQIYYINQEEFGEKFTAILADMGLKGEITPASYEVRIGGDNLSEVVTFDIEAKGGTTKVMYGDASGNGIIEAEDATVILQYLAGWDVTLGGSKAEK